MEESGILRATPQLGGLLVVSELMNWKRIIKSSTGRSVEFEDFGEHHMSSNHMRVKLPQAFEGISEFHTTNGYASFSDDGEFLLIADACMLIVLSYKEGQARHCYPPAGWYFKSPSIVGSSVEAGLYNSNGDGGDFGPLAISDAAWQSGFGRASKGLLPSVHVPFYKATFSKGAT